MDDSMLALFLLLGQTAGRTASTLPGVAPTEPLLLSDTYDLGILMPDTVREAIAASQGYRLFFVFENYLRELVVEVLSKDAATNWWDKVPKDVQDDVAKLEQTEEAKRWMAIGSRDKSALMTYPQLLRVIEECWAVGFDDLLRDKSLVQEARLLTHLRNTLCHMAPISEEEMQRVRQVMRDWFRMVAP